MQNTNTPNFSMSEKAIQSLHRHFDDASAFYFQEELTTKLPETFLTAYADLNGPKLIPIKSTINPMSGDRFGEYDIMDMAGKPKWQGDRTTDKPFADAKIKRYKYQVYKRELLFDFSSEDIAYASRGNRSLVDSKRLSTIQSHAQDTNQLMFFGDYDKFLQDDKFFGWLNHPLITKIEVAAATTGKTWSVKTGLDMVRDLNTAIDTILTSTNNTEVPDTIALPLAQYRLLQTTQVGNGLDTAMDFFMKTNPGINVEAANELKGAYPTGNKDIFVCYKKRDMNFWFDTYNLQFSEIFQQSIDLFTVKAEVWHGGILLIRPKSQLITYGI